jgi:uncharacterized repeat protein (TIGR03803 family)
LKTNFWCIPLLTLVILTLTLTVSAQYTETILYDFGAVTSNGANPETPVVFDAAGNLYGTTGNGGTLGYGTVFELSPNAGGGWTETILYNFAYGADAGFPHSISFDSHGNLFGVAQGGNTSCYTGCGTIFELSPNSGGGWTEKVIYSFTGTYDGSGPAGPLAIDTSGNLFGTTQGGGRFQGGTVFELSPASGGGWTFHHLLTFNYSNGASPQSGVILDSAGNLYGVAPYAGRGSDGVVYQLSPSSGGSWTFTILHTFYGALGAIPDGLLTFDAAGNLYGTTQQGGKNVSPCSGGCGVVFKLTPASGPWLYSLLHEFSGPDGWQPQAGITLDSAGNVYGVAANGGTGSDGTAFKLSPVSGGWKFETIFDFAQSTGTFPYTNVTLDASGNVYGTTLQGGANCAPYGCGLVYELSAPASTQR